MNFFKPLFLKSLLCVGLSAVALGGCERPVNRASHGLPMPAQTYAHIERLVVDVAGVDIVRGLDNSRADVMNFPMSLQDQAELYFTRKFEASGGAALGERLVVRIDETRIERSQRGSTSKLLQKIDVDKVDQYVIQLNVTLEHQGVRGDVIYGRSLSVRKMFEISEHDSPATRERKRFMAVEDMFGILDPEVNRVVGSEMNL